MDEKHKIDEILVALTNSIHLVSFNSLQIDYVMSPRNEIMRTFARFVFRAFQLFKSVPQLSYSDCAKKYTISNTFFSDGYIPGIKRRKKTSIYCRWIEKLKSVVRRVVIDLWFASHVRFVYCRINSVITSLVFTIILLAISYMLFALRCSLCDVRTLTEKWKNGLRKASGVRANQYIGKLATRQILTSCEIGALLKFFLSGLSEIKIKM